jgi:hypothetical protein
MEALFLLQILTNFWELQEINFSAISLIYIVNDSGPRTDVWGTPAETMQSEEDELFINTLCCRSCR